MATFDDFYRSLPEDSNKRGEYFEKVFIPWFLKKEKLMTVASKKMTICITPEMSAAIEGRRKQWGLKSKGEVIERLVDWMTKEPVEG